MLKKFFDLDLSTQIWIGTVFSVVLLTLVLNYIVSRIFKRILPKLENSKNLWDDALVRALTKPVGILIWLIGFSFAAHLVSMKIDSETMSHFFIHARQVGIVLLLMWFVTRFVSELEEILTTPSRHQLKLDKGTVQAMCQFVRLAVIITAVLIGLQTFDINISGFLAVGGVGTFVVGFAAKDWLANFFGGLMVYLDRPFTVGDWIRSPDKKIEGTVESIGWRLTRIRTFDKRPLYVPNAVFSTIAIENPSRMNNRRIYQKIGLRYDDSRLVAKVLADVKQMLCEHEEIDQKQIMLVNLIEFGESALVFLVYTFTKTTNWVKFQDIQQDVFLKILEIIDANGAQCAFPTTTMHVPDGIQMQAITAQEDAQ